MAQAVFVKSWLVVGVQSDAGGYFGLYENSVLLKSQESCQRHALDRNLQLDRGPCLAGPLNDLPSTGVTLPSSAFIFRVTRSSRVGPSGERKLSISRHSSRLL